MKIIVYHSYYGCDTGCCGHAIEVDGKDCWLDFDHPSTNEEKEEWAIQQAKNWVKKNLNEEHAFDLDWKNCISLENC